MGETKTCSLCFIVENGRWYTNTIRQIHVRDIIDRTHGVTCPTGLVGEWMAENSHWKDGRSWRVYTSLMFGFKWRKKLVVGCCLSVMNISDLVLCQYLGEGHILPVHTTITLYTCLVPCKVCNRTCRKVITLEFLLREIFIPYQKVTVEKCSVYSIFIILSQ